MREQDFRHSRRRDFDADSYHPQPRTYATRPRFSRPTFEATSNGLMRPPSSERPPCPPRHASAHPRVALGSAAIRAAALVCNYLRADGCHGDCAADHGKGERHGDHQLFHLFGLPNIHWFVHAICGGASLIRHPEDRRSITETSSRLCLAFGMGDGTDRRATLQPSDSIKRESRWGSPGDKHLASGPCHVVQYPKIGKPCPAEH